MSDAAEEFPSLEISRQNGCTTIKLRSPGLEGTPAGSDVHTDLGELISRLRGDLETRVIVLTGALDGVFYRPAGRGAAPRNAISAPSAERLHKLFTGITRFHEAMASLDKVVIARVNGDAIGFGASIMWGCDLIVARKDAIICDNHIEQTDDEPFDPLALRSAKDGQHIPTWRPCSNVPGDGGTALVPSHMPPALAKEYLLLARIFTAAEFERLGIINYAVEADRVDFITDAMVARLLSRSAHSLASTKRLTNQTFAAEMRSRLDAGLAYEMVAFYQQALSGGVPAKTLG